jgi:pyruvate, water dikinase
MNETKPQEQTVMWLEDVTNDDVARVGGKNASLGEMIRELKAEGVRVPGGFATTAEAYREFLAANDLEDQIRDQLRRMENEPDSARRVGKAIRRLILKADIPQEIEEAIGHAYRGGDHALVRGGGRRDDF